MSRNPKKKGAVAATTTPDKLLTNDDVRQLLLPLQHGSTAQAIGDNPPATHKVSVIPSRNLIRVGEVSRKRRKSDREETVHLQADRTGKPRYLNLHLILRMLGSSTERWNPVVGSLRSGTVGSCART